MCKVLSGLCVEQKLTDESLSTLFCEVEKYNEQQTSHHIFG